MLKDSAAYGIIVTQGYGRFGKLPVSTPSMIRFGQMTEDELFVSAAAAAEGVMRTCDRTLVSHFGPIPCEALARTAVVDAKGRAHQRSRWRRPRLRAAPQAGASEATGRRPVFAGGGAPGELAGVGPREQQINAD